MYKVSSVGFCKWKQCCRQTSLLRGIGALSDKNGTKKHAAGVREAVDAREARGAGRAGPGLSWAAAKGTGTPRGAGHVPLGPEASPDIPLPHGRWVEPLASPHDPDRAEDVLSYTKLHLWNLTDYQQVTSPADCRQVTSPPTDMTSSHVPARGLHRLSRGGPGTIA